MKSFNTEAIILNTEDYGESDRLVSFYAETGGRLKGIAKGARRSRKRFVHSLEPCSFVELVYRDGKSLVWIEACKLLEPHLELRTDVERWGYAALVSEIVLEMAPEGESQQEVFHLLRESMDRLSQDRDSLNVALLFIFRFLDLMGYLPALDGCSVCRKPLRGSTRWFWRAGEGILVCPEHRAAQEDYLGLDLGTLVLIQQSRQLPLDRIWRLRFRNGKKTPLLRCLLDSIRSQIRKSLKSVKVLEQIQSA